MLHLHPVPAFHDNYIWLIHDPAGNGVVVDPGDADVVFEALKRLSLRLETILVTHHHVDHTGGVDALRNATGAVVFGPLTETMPEPIRRLQGGDKAQAMGVPIDEINTTLAVMFGSDYIGDFMLNGQVRRVTVQADGKRRVDVDDISRLHVRNLQGQMVPLSAFATLKWSMGPPQLNRYNGFPSFTINGSAAPGHSSGEAMRAMETLAAELPRGIGFDWSGQSYEERLSGNQAPVLFALSVLIVFLALAALYESWSIPLAVILVVPLGVLGVLLATLLRGYSNDVYFQVGLITIIGLSAKNAILIIEFAKDLQAQGKGLIESALEAAHLRFRPIVMTSMAFTLGVVPLAIASGAGSASQRAIGTGVIGGMLTGTILAVVFVPIFFVVVRSLFKGSDRQRRRHAADAVGATKMARPLSNVAR